MTAITRLVRRHRAVPLLALAALLATACGGGAPTEQNPVTAPPAPPGYSGPAPASQDVQAFKVNVWDNLQASNRCGSCHGTGGQSPQFVRSDDINLAYTAANTVANLADPARSRLVTKVGGGHNCWLGSDAASASCAVTRSRVMKFLTNMRSSLLPYALVNDHRVNPRLG